MESVFSRTNKIKSFIYIPHEPQPNLICKHNIYIIMPLGNFHFISYPFVGVSNIHMFQIQDILKQKQNGGQNELSTTISK